MIKKFVPFLVLVLFATTLAAQEVCPPFVQQAIERIGTSCVLTERNQACYGNGLIGVEPQPNVRLEPFDVAGDKVALTAVKALTLSPLNVDNNEWGLSVLQVQANLPDTLPGQNVTMIVSGDVSLENAGNAMEAFYFRGGIGAPGCASAPNGIVIQTPEGAGQVELTANNLTFSIGSTLILETFDTEGLQTRLETAETDAVEVADDATLLSYTLVEGTGTLQLPDGDAALEPLQTSVYAVSEDGAAELVASYPAPLEDLTASYGEILGALPEPIDTETLGEVTTETPVASGDCVPPKSGTWAFEIVEADTSACAFMGDQIAGAFSEMQSVAINFPDPFSMESFFASNPDFMSMGLISTQEDGCTYNAQMDDSSIVLDYTFILQTEDSMGFKYAFSSTDADFSCSVTIDIQMTRVGD